MTVLYKQKTDFKDEVYDKFYVLKLILGQKHFRNDANRDIPW